MICEGKIEDVGKGVRGEKERGRGGEREIGIEREREREERGER